MTIIPLGAADTLLKNGEMKRFDLDDKAILLSRVDGEYYAIRSTCSHWSANLADGALVGTTLTCPWHHACFDVRSGMRLEPPALNDLPRFNVTVENGEVMVDTEPVAPAPIPGAGGDARTFVIIGGGGAGEAAAEELRRQGFGGKIVILSATAELPVDRPNLSKDYLDGHAKPEWMPLRGENWYAERGIDLRRQTWVAGVDIDNKVIVTADGERINYDALLIATGGAPRTLDVPGKDLGNIFTLREQADADKIKDAAGEGKRTVIVGASFIGMEAASALASTGNQVTIVGIEAVPFDQIWGAEIGGFFQRLHEDNGVQFRLDSGVEEYIGGDGLVSGVRIKDGEVLPCDYVVVGVGVSPATDFLDGSGLTLHERDQSVLVDERLQAAPHVFAAGDIARFPWDGDTARIEHWRVAQQHGLIAARGMLGKTDTIKAHLPFFWTTQWGVSIRYVGYAADWDEIVMRGSVESGKFVAFYIKNGELTAAAGVGHDRDMAALERILLQGITLSPAQMRDSGFDLVAAAGA